MMQISRRGFLAGSAAVLAALALRPERLDAGVLDRLFGRAARDTSAITPNEEFYLTSIGSAPRMKIESWSLRIKGLVKRPITLTYEDLLKRSNTTMISTLECIGNPVGGDSIGTAKWEGVKLNSLLDEAGVRLDQAVDLVLRASDGYSDSLPTKRAMREEVLLVTKMNGVPLPPVHGFPARVIVPGIYGMKNVKWLTELELAKEDHKGYWERRGWSDEAEVKTMSRIDAPGDGDTLQGADYLIRGIAFSGTRTIQRVEISTDGGVTWHEAVLEPALSPYSWIFWKYRWKAPSPGRYTMTVRAIDGAGVTQSADIRSAYPDGKSGLHTVSVTVTT